MSLMHKLTRNAPEILYEVGKLCKFWTCSLPSPVITSGPISTMSKHLQQGKNPYTPKAPSASEVSDKGEDKPEAVIAVVVVVLTKSPLQRFRNPYTTPPPKKRTLLAQMKFTKTQSSTLKPQIERTRKRERELLDRERRRKRTSLPEGCRSLEQRSQPAKRKRKRARGARGQMNERCMSEGLAVWGRLSGS